MRYDLAIKKNEKCHFQEFWMDLEIVIVSGVKERQIMYDTVYMWNLN